MKGNTQGNRVRAELGAQHFSKLYCDVRIPGIFDLHKREYFPIIFEKSVENSFGIPFVVFSESNSWACGRGFLP